MSNCKLHLARLAALVLFVGLVLCPKATYSATGDSNNVNLTGRFPFGPCGAVAGSGASVWIGHGGMFHVLDMTDPLLPVEQGALAMPSAITDIERDGAWAYVTCGSDGLWSVNVPDPLSPASGSNVATPDSANALVVVGTRAFVAAGKSGLRIIDISNPLAMSEIGSFDTPGFAVDVAVSGNYAYVADSDSGLRIINVSNPASPTEAGAYTAEAVWAVASDGTYAYVTNIQGVGIIDVTTPASPSLIGQYYAFLVQEVTVSGTLLYALDIGGSLAIVNVSNPAVPAQSGIVYGAGFGYGISLAGPGLAYVADGGAGLGAVDITDPADPFLLGGYQTAGFLQDVVTDGTVAYLAMNGVGLVSVDVSVASDPAYMDDITTGGEAKGVALQNSAAYLADGGWGMNIVDVSSPAALSSVGSYSGRAVEDLVLVRNLVYAASSTDGISIFDLSGPTPQLIGWAGVAGSAYGIASEGDYAFLTLGSSGMWAFNVADSTTPSAVGSTPVSGYAYDLAVSNGRAYVAAAHGGLRIFDVSDPTSMTELGFYDTPGEAHDVAVVGNLAYVADGSAGLRVIYVVDPAAPTEVGYYDTGNTAVGVWLDGTTAYVADGENGMYELNVAAATPVLLQAFDVTNADDGVRLEWHVSDELDIASYDVYRAANSAPTRVASVPATGASHYAIVDPDVTTGAPLSYTLFAVETSGSRILLAERRIVIAAPALTLSQNRPNPFNPGTSISFDMPRSAPVTLEIFDIAGRRVRTLVSGVVPAGHRTYTWDARDDRGRLVPSGVYVYRLKTSGRSLGRKMVLVR